LRQNQKDIINQDNGISSGKQSGNQQFTNQSYDDVAASFVNSIFDDFEYIMGTGERYELEKEIRNINSLIEKRENVVRQFAVANNPYTDELFDELSSEITNLNEQLSSLRKKESNKVNESINLHNRIAYQVFPKRFESVENVLRQQLEEIRAEKDKLESQIQEKRKEYKELCDKRFGYADECIKNDSELLQLRETLQEKKQKLNNLKNPHRRR